MPLPLPILAWPEPLPFFWFRRLGPFPLGPASPSSSEISEDEISETESEAWSPEVGRVAGLPDVFRGAPTHGSAGEAVEAVEARDGSGLANVTPCLAFPEGGAGRLAACATRAAEVADELSGEGGMTTVASSSFPKDER